MKKIFLTLGILLSGVSVLSVQAASRTTLLQTEAQKSPAAKRLETIQRVCKTTPDQTSKVQALLNDFFSKQAENEKANKGNAAALKEASKKNSYNFNQQLQKVLSPEQVKALNASDIEWSKSQKTK